MRIEPAQGNQKLMKAGVPALPVETCTTRQAKALQVGAGNVVVLRPIHEPDYW